MTDAQLVALALAGNARAFGALVTRSRDLAVSVAYAATGDVGLAEDLAQEAFVVAWRRLASLTHRERFAPWLCGIVRHVARSERRHRRRHAPGGGSGPEVLDGLAAARPSPLDEAIARQALARTWHALRALPPRYREPLVLYCRLDHSHARVAESLGLSEETVRQRVSRARQKLRDEVDGVERQVRAARGPTAAGVIALIWSRSTAAGAAPAASGGTPWLLAVAAPLAAVAAAIVITSAALTASRALASAESALPAAPSVAAPAAGRAAPPTPAQPAPRPSVEMGAGAVDRPVEFAFAAVVEPAAAARPRRGRVVRHGPAVVMPDDPPRPLLRPTLDIDPASFIP